MNNFYKDMHITQANNFTVHDALILRRWDTYAEVDYKAISNIVDICYSLDMITEIIGKKPIITSWIRTPEYNNLIGGSRRSHHITGGAVDFKFKGIKADDVRKELKDYLLMMDIRMENLPGSNWIHIDNKPVGRNRFFSP